MRDDAERPSTCARLPRVRRPISAPSVLLCLAIVLALSLSACGGGESTVTVTETVPASQSADQSGNGSNPDDVSSEKGAITGYVDNLAVEADSLILTGWAAPSDLSEAAGRVKAEVGGQTVAEAVPAIERQDVVEALGKPGLAQSGFELRIPLDSLECGAPAAGIEVIASLNGASSTLEYGQGIEEAVADAC